MTNELIRISLDGQKRKYLVTPYIIMTEVEFSLMLSSKYQPNELYTRQFIIDVSNSIDIFQ